MAYVIAEPCIGTKDTACVDACPVDCIHPKKDDPRFEVEELLYIDPVEFLQSLRRAADREMVLAGPASGSVGQIAEGLERRREIDVRLTERERQVLSVAAEGLTAREIAGRLGVRERTITTHLARIYGKLGVGSRLAAIRIAARAGLVSVGPAD